MVLAVLGRLGLERAVAELLGHQLLLEQLLALTAAGVVGQLVDGLAAAGDRLGHFVDLGFVGVLRVYLLLN